VYLLIVNRSSKASISFNSCTDFLALVTHGSPLWNRRETSAAAAAILWFMSARVRLRKRSLLKHGLASGLDDPRALLRLVYEQSQWSAWAAIAAGLAAIFAIADGFAR
jgi:hypothetical protein